MSLRSKGRNLRKATIIVTITAFVLAFTAFIISHQKHHLVFAALWLLIAVASYQTKI